MFGLCLHCADQAFKARCNAIHNHMSLWTNQLNLYCHVCSIVSLRCVEGKRRMFLLLHLLGDLLRYACIIWIASPQTVTMATLDWIPASYYNTWFPSDWCVRDFKISHPIIQACMPSSVLPEDVLAHLRQISDQSKRSITTTARLL